VQCCRPFVAHHADAGAKNSCGMTLACNLLAGVALYIALYCVCETIVELAMKAVSDSATAHVSDGDEADAHYQAALHICGC